MTDTEDEEADPKKQRHFKWPVAHRPLLFSVKLPWLSRTIGGHLGFVSTWA